VPCNNGCSFHFKALHDNNCFLPLSHQPCPCAGSFNNWTNAIPLRQSVESGDHVRSVVLSPGPVEYKFVVDFVWRHSPRDAISVNTDTGSINNQKIVGINGMITWPADGSEWSVYVAGSFLAWAEIVPLTPNSSGDYNVNCCFPVRFFCPFSSASCRGQRMLCNWWNALDTTSCRFTRTTKLGWP
jgi:hypothetical protein